MCGISGVWGRAEPALIRSMLDTLKHRGPDAWGTHVHGQQGVLGHRRLSIMDPVGGDQPLYNEDRSMAIVANGEVYNYPQLRRDLEARHQFSTGNDSEAVLHHFEENASRVVHHLDGMFAFAIASDDGLFMARDPIGIKPLYYGYRHKNTPEEAICFASELKALVPWAEEVREFPPGTYYHSDVGFVPYYQVPQRQPEDRPVEDWCRSLRQTLEAAVTKRLMSDVPVGAFLSGGLDSSLIAALMRPHVDQLHTFSVGIEGSRDIEAARRVARHIDSTHHEYLFTAQDVLDKLPEIIYYLESFDQDLVRSAIPCYFCSRLAADHVKVILTGEGADELFAGYTYYRDIEDPQALHRELHRSVSQLHNINLQRVDRLTMAHGLEGRVPFLDVNLIEFAQLIPPQLKLHDDGSGRRVEKWILRQACADLLPADIVWRQKEQFDEGSGTVDLLAQVLDRATADIDYEAYIRKYPLVELRSVEECHYHRLLCAAFDQPEAVVQNVARWAQRT